MKEEKTFLKSRHSIWVVIVLMLKREPVCQSAFTISNMEDMEKARTKLNLYIACAILIKFKK